MPTEAGSAFDAVSRRKGLKQCRGGAAGKAAWCFVTLPQDA